MTEERFQQFYVFFTLANILKLGLNIFHQFQFAQFLDNLRWNRRRSQKGKRKVH